MRIEVALRMKGFAVALRAGGPVQRLVGLFWSSAYRAYSLFLLGMDIPTSVRMGKGVAVYHSQGLVIHASAVIGDGVSLRHSTTIGASDIGGAPVIESRVDVGANVVIIGDVIVGVGARIGAGSVVVSNVGAGVTVVGNPARAVKRVARDED